MKKYGLLGEKLGHSFSPQIHAQLNDYEYKLYEVDKDKLEEFMTTTDLSGFNVTIPYKQAVIPFCTSLSPAAESIGSVNTVVRLEDGSFFGDNTDYYGFEYLLKSSGVSPEGKKAIVLGSGGASKTVVAVLKESGVSELTVLSRTGGAVPGTDNYGNLDKYMDAEIIVNATPVGMYPKNGDSPLDLTGFTRCELVLDLIYNPAKTAILLQAEALGIPAFNGLSMLVAQAKKACDIFTGTQGPDESIPAITKQIADETKNIVLIGMPGSGKSTIGKCLSEKLGREFIDLDDEIVKEAGIPIPEIFARGGEEEFRQIETAVTAKNLKLSGKIIATGGGVVTRPENKDLLRQNGTVVLLKRPLAILPTDGRPLSQARKLEEIYNERREAYESWCDFYADVTVPEETTASILEKLQKGDRS